MKKLSLITLFAFFGISSIHAGAIGLPDPTIFYDNGTYYLTGTWKTSTGFAMYASTDLFHWALCDNGNDGVVLSKDDVCGTTDFWAPHVFYYNDSYYMAYAANEHIGIARSDSPMGPYTQEVQEFITEEEEQIDPFVFFDDDGKIYLYYSRLNNGQKIYVLELTEDLKIDTSFDPVLCLEPVATWENVSNERVVEGPTVIKDGEYYYLIYSANGYTNINYALGYAYSTSPTGPWTKKSKPFISRHNVGINGTGHGDLFQDTEGNWYYVFHVHASNTSVHTRRACIVPITLTDDPENKFIPELDRMIILQDDYEGDAVFPANKEIFEENGVMYKVEDEEAKEVKVAPLDNIEFEGYEGILTIPETVTHNGETYTIVGVGLSAFYNSLNLERLSLPSTIASIDIGGMESCGIWKLELHSPATTFDYYSLHSSGNILDIIIDNIEAPSIDDSDLSSSTISMGKLWIPEGSAESYQTTNIWSEFKRFSGVEEPSPRYDFYVDGLYYSIVDESDATCELSPQSGLYATYREKDIDIPECIPYDDKEYTVMGIGSGALRDSRMVETVEIPEGVEYIDSYAFYGMYCLTEITLPKSLTDVGDYAFRSSPALTSITCLAETPPTIKRVAFSDEAFEGILYVPYGTSSLYADATEWRKFENIIELEYDGIETINTTSRRNDNATYNLSGMRVNDSYKGIVIRNGKKYVQ